MDTRVGNINFKIELCNGILNFLHSSLTIDKLGIITFTFSMKYEETLLQGVALTLFLLGGHIVPPSGFLNRMKNWPGPKARCFATFSYI